MSERQAKLKRKNEVVNTPAKKKSALDIVSNIIIVVLILAVLGIGCWAVYSKFSQMPSNEEAVTPTISEYAQTEGITVEEFLIKYGLSEVPELTGDSLISDAMSYMTLGNYAALVGTDVSEIKASMGLAEDYADDTPMSVIYEEMAAAADTAEAENVEAESTEVAE